MLQPQDRGKIARATFELDCLEEVGSDTRGTVELKISEADLP